MQASADILVRDGVVETWWAEFMGYWRRLPNHGLFLWLAAAWLLLFHVLGNGGRGYVPTSSLYVWMFCAYNGSTITDDSHGNIIPFVVLWLLWWKRDELVAGRLRSWPPAMLLVVLGMALHLFGFGVQYNPISIVGLFTGLYGLLGLAWGPAFLRASFFPFVLFVFSVPMGRVMEPITFNLRLFMASIVEFVAHGVLGINVVREGTGLYDAAGGYQYDVAAACSGLRSLWAMFVLATAYGYVTFRRSWSWVALMAAAFPLAVIGNSVRLLVIIVVATVAGRKWGDWVHENPIFSLLPYVPVTLGLAFLTQGITKFKEALAKERAKENAK